MTADSSIFDNGSNVMIKKKKTKRLDISYMNRIRDDFLGDDSPSNRPVRDLIMVLVNQAESPYVEINIKIGNFWSSF